jgi:acetate kinase
VAIRKFIAAYASVLGGLDMLIFAGGIGEHSVQVRSGVCNGLTFLGIAIDATKNEASDGMISTPGSSAKVCVVPSQEDRQIARHCRALMRKS